MADPKDSDAVFYRGRPEGNETWKVHTEWFQSGWLWLLFGTEPLRTKDNKGVLLLGKLLQSIRRYHGVGWGLMGKGHHPKRFAASSSLFAMCSRMVCTSVQGKRIFRHEVSGVFIQDGLSNGSITTAAPTGEESSVDGANHKKQAWVWGSYLWDI